MRARLREIRAGRGTGPDVSVEVLLYRRLGPDTYEAFARPARRLRQGNSLSLGRTCAAVVLATGEAGTITLRFEKRGAELDAAIAVEGELPLPPYIPREHGADESDDIDYQTIYARHDGSVAAPTAGLHFSPALFEALDARGIAREAVTLHVGPGTFLPVTANDTADHRMHSEHAALSAETAARLNAARTTGGRICAVGTTSLAHAGERGRAGRPACRLRRRDRHLHHARLPLPRGGRAADQFPSAALDPVHAGLAPSAAWTRCRRPMPRRSRRTIASIPMATPACYSGAA